MSYSLAAPALATYARQLTSSGKRQISTTIAFVRLLSALVQAKDIGNRVLPIVPDAARTFGMEGMFLQFVLYSSVGQRYPPLDSDGILY